MARLVVSLTTTPRRLKTVIASIDSILKNDITPDAIYLNIPKVFSRTGQPYPPIPDDILKLPLVVVNMIDRDLGPASKVLPVTKKEKNPNTLIIFIDDDIIFPKDFIHSMLWIHARHPGCAVTGFGCYDSVQTKPIDEYCYETVMFMGLAGVLLERRMLNNWHQLINFQRLPKTCFMSDDLVLSNLVLKRGYRIIAIKTRYLMAKLKFNPSAFNDDALHNINSVLDRYKDCLDHLRSSGIWDDRLVLAHSNWWRRLIESGGDRFFKLIIFFAPLIKLNLPRFAKDRS